MRRLCLTGSAVVLLIACSDTTYSSSGGGGCTPTATQVCAQTTTFSPANLTITAGQTVTWKNSSGYAHTVTSATGSAEVFDGNLSNGGAVSHMFPNKGTFEYYCKIHGANGAPPTGMSGTITVQ